MDVSIIIVNYNTKELTRNCLNSIFKQTKEISFEVIVSDNGSTDGSIEMIKVDFPHVILIENNVNLGFGAANNRGLTKATGKYVFYLNSDTVLLNNAVKIFFDYWENAANKERIGALGAILLDYDLRPCISYGKFPTTKNELWYLFKCFLSSMYIKKLWLKVCKGKHIEYSVGYVDYVIGADLFLKNNSSSFFDERYFMYYEETDLQLHLAKHGLHRIIIDTPKIIHFEGGTSNEDKSFYDFRRKTAIYYWQSCLRYVNKNLGNSWQQKILRLILILIFLLPKNIKFTFKEIKGLCT